MRYSEYVEPVNKKRNKEIREAQTVYASLTLAFSDRENFKVNELSCVNAPYGKHAKLARYSIGYLCAD